MVVVFPKEVKALTARAKELGYSASLLRTILKVNAVQSYRNVELIKRLVGQLKDRRIAVFEFSF